jgi:predicted amidophosphoribosyltransferase
MPTSDESWSARLRKIGDLERPDHSYLSPSDECFFFGEYTARAGYSHSNTNSIISNLKKSPSLRGTSQWQHKERAIRECGAAIASNIKSERLSELTFVPIPPSKSPSSADYDDRITLVARAISPQADVREILYCAADREAMHTNQNHRDPNALRNLLGTRTELIANPRPIIVLIDDVVTTGCSFSVCKAILGRYWPASQIVGIFIARRAVPKLFNVAELDLDL